MRKILAFVFLLVGTPLAAQTSWFVGSERYLEHEDAAYYAGFLWRINDSRAFGFRDSVNVAPSGGIDTVFFQTAPERGWDTLFCFIPKGKRVEWVYNACCSYFDPYVNDQRMHDTLVVYSDYRQPLYVGTWEGGVVVPKKATAFSVFRTPKSALTPTIYGLTVRPSSEKEELEETAPPLFFKSWIFFGEPIALYIDKKGLVTVSPE